MIDKLMYVGQKAFIEKNGEVLVLNDPKMGLDFPGGKIQEKETSLVEALQREVREETGIEIEVGNPFYTWTIEYPPDHRNQGHVFLVGYTCKYLSGEVILSHEHNRFQWVNKETYKGLQEDSDYFRALENYFSLNNE